MNTKSMPKSPKPIRWPLTAPDRQMLAESLVPMRHSVAVLHCYRFFYDRQKCSAVKPGLVYVAVYMGARKQCAHTSDLGRRNSQTGKTARARTSKYTASPTGNSCCRRHNDLPVHRFFAIVSPAMLVVGSVLRSNGRSDDKCVPNASRDL
jgi:hypothetical protein